MFKKIQLASILLMFGFLATSNFAEKDIEISNAWIRLPPPGTAITAMYMDIKNSLNEDILLVGARSDFFERVEIHNISSENGTMVMEKLDSVKISKNNRLQFKPGSYHLMLFKPTQSLLNGEKVIISLNFASGITKAINIPVVAK